MPASLRLPHCPRLRAALLSVLMLLDLGSLAFGLFAWTLLEYVIHGPLSHVWASPIAGFHDFHHRDPHAVFTVRAWTPVAVIYTAVMLWFGIRPATLALSGLLAGFLTYELIHYRIHFAWPASAFEARLRARHLAHHLRAPDAWFGVTSPLWDRAFGTEPPPAKMNALAASVAGVAPLTGRSNAWRVLRLGMRVR